MEKNMKKKLLTGILMLAALVFTACDSTDDTVYVPTTLSVEMPLGLDHLQFSDAEATFTDVQTNTVYTVTQFTDNNGTFTAPVGDLPEGTYNVAVKGNLTFTKDGVAGTAKVDQQSDNVTVKTGSAEVKLAVNTFDAKGGFVISEIFFAGTQTPQGKQYTKDQYVILSNNSDVTLYADSIAFVEAAFLSTIKRDYTPDMLSEAMSVQAIYMIPGTGTSVSVAPGASLILAVNATNHTEANANSFDLNDADFEFYDESSVASQQDTDNPDVPNLDKWYCYSNSYFILNNQGTKSYAIARMRQDKDSYLADNYYEAKYTAVTGKEMTTKCYKVANSWILDAVNLAPSSAWQWNLVSSALDAGYAYVAATGADKARYGKSVIRKKADGKWVDTNNSSNDFEMGATASFLQQ